MSVSNQPRFRQIAVKNYLQGREKYVFPRFISLPIPLFLWFLLALLVIVLAIAWNERVPSSVTGSGVVVPEADGWGDENTTAVIFLTPLEARKLQPMQPVRLLMNDGQMQLNSYVTGIATTAVSPQEIRKRYQLEPCVLSLSQPMIVATVRLENATAATYAGSIFKAEVDVGTERMLALLPLIGQFFQS